MPLSEHEQRILEQLERDLATDDPKLATAMTHGHRTSAKRIAVGALGVVAGLVMLFIGVAKSLAVVGIIGFVIMVLAIWYAVTSDKTQSLTLLGPDGKPISHSKTGSGPGSAPRKKQSFTSKMEERWEKRSRGDQF